MYSYHINNIRVIDGDTVDADIDLGFNIKIRDRIRLFGINAPETRTRDLKEKELGLKAKERLIEIIAEREVDSIYVATVFYKRGKYGRILGTLFYYNGDGERIDINHMLLDEGYAVIYEK